MNAEFIFVADRGGLKIYLWDRTAPSPLRLVENVMIPEARGRFADEVTDQAGAFPNAGGGQSVAERQGIGRENEARSLRQIAAKIREVLAQHRHSRWSLAAPAEINAALLEHLDPALLRDLIHNLRKDLVNAPAEEIPDHFGRHRTPGTDSSPPISRSEFS